VNGNLSQTNSIREFDPATASDEDMFKLSDLLDVLFRELEKDDPLPTKEYRSKAIRYNSPDFDEFWWLVWEDKKVIGFSTLSIRNENSASYEENKHIAYFQIRIRNDRRREGIGTKLLKKIIQKSKEFSVVTTLQTSTAYKSGFKFNEKMNGVLAMEATESRCRLAEVDWNLMEEWRIQGQKRGKEEERTLRWFEKCPEEIIEEFCNVYTETMNQQPLGEIETRARITPESRRKTEKQFDELGYIWHGVISHESNGAISGITDVTFMTDRPYKIYQELTGVKIEYRGKGLGKWLKSEMLFFIKKKYPDLKYITTSNATTNEAMLSINHRMGFKLHQERKSYKYKIVDLEKRLTENESN
jgi:ribosomal protein S18 acetylase RimI-like enzyme